jgi:hypothetical protein
MRGNRKQRRIKQDSPAMVDPLMQWAVRKRTRDLTAMAEVKKVSGWAAAVELGSWDSSMLEIAWMDGWMDGSPEKGGGEWRKACVASRDTARGEGEIERSKKKSSGYAGRDDGEIKKSQPANQSGGKRAACRPLAGRNPKMRENKGW